MRLARIVLLSAPIIGFLLSWVDSKTLIMSVKVIQRHDKQTFAIPSNTFTQSAPEAISLVPSK